MTVEEGFVDRDILNGAQTHTRFNLGDSIDKQEGVPVGQDLSDSVNINSVLSSQTWQLIRKLKLPLLLAILALRQVSLEMKVLMN